jgi:hypothetical protein
MGSKSSFVNFTVWTSTLGGVFYFNRFVDVNITNGRFSNIKIPLYGGAIYIENCENVFISKSEVCKYVFLIYWVFLLFFLFF